MDLTTNGSPTPRQPSWTWRSGVLAICVHLIVLCVGLVTALIASAARLAGVTVPLREQVELAAAITDYIRTGIHGPPSADPPFRCPARSSGHARSHRRPGPKSREATT